MIGCHLLCSFIVLVVFLHICHRYDTKSNTIGWHSVHITMGYQFDTTHSNECNPMRLITYSSSMYVFVVVFHLFDSLSFIHFHRFILYVILKSVEFLPISAIENIFLEEKKKTRLIDNWSQTIQYARYFLYFFGRVSNKSNIDKCFFVTHGSAVFIEVTCVKRTTNNRILLNILVDPTNENSKTAASGIPDSQRPNSIDFYFWITFQTLNWEQNSNKE